MGLDPDALLNVAAADGLDKSWVLEKVRSPRTAWNAQAPKEHFTCINAFNAGAENLKTTLNSNQEPYPAILLYSLHAATYLANTRTLLWFEVKGNRSPLASGDEDRLLALLQSQVQTASTLAANTIQLLWTSHKRPCEGYRELSKNVIANMAAIIIAEEEITQYNQGK